MSLTLSELTLREVEIFVLSCRTRSLRETSRQSGLLPGHVSKIIRRLEEKVGQPLFRRSSSGMMPTPEGLALLDPASRIFEISQDLQARRPKPASREQLWTFGAISFLATYLLAPRLDAWRARSRNTRFRLLEFTHNDLVGHGLQGAFDLAVHIEALEWTQIWESFPLGSLSWRLYGRRGHPLGARSSETEALAFPFIVPTDWSPAGYTIGEDFCPASPRVRRKGDEAATAETALEICRNSDQLTFVPELLARRWCEAGVIQEVAVTDWPVIEKEIFLTVRADRVSRRLVSLIRESLAGKN